MTILFTEIEQELEALSSGPRVTYDKILMLLLGGDSTILVTPEASEQLLEQLLGRMRVVGVDYIEEEVSGDRMDLCALLDLNEVFGWSYDEEDYGRFKLVVFDEDQLRYVAALSKVKRTARDPHGNLCWDWNCRCPLGAPAPKAPSTRTKGVQSFCHWEVYPTGIQHARSLIKTFREYQEQAGWKRQDPTLISMRHIERRFKLELEGFQEDFPQTWVALLLQEGINVDVQPEFLGKLPCLCGRTPRCPEKAWHGFKHRRALGRLPRIPTSAMRPFDPVEWKRLVRNREARERYAMKRRHEGARRRFNDGASYRTTT